ncbi:MAG: NADH-quinone oxidoreductase subunit L [Paracoccaceae bacterium]|nr:NADH-quinone oxidoreductase subunit L [Paracoccaceae bacterium]
MEIILVFAPLAGCLFAGFAHRFVGERAALATSTGLLFLSAILAWFLFQTFDGETRVVPLARWVESGSLSTDWALRIDRLTVVMLVVITTVSSLVHLYSWGYMDGDSNWQPGESYRPRFFAFLSFFTFAMLMLVTADNLLQLFFGWEGVGVASYLLIGFYYRKPSANAAAIKAFIVNRVGDFGFALGIFGLFLLTDSINFSVILDPETAKTLSESRFEFLGRDVPALEVLALLLFIGAMGKSAQFLLHTWLPDAMEGPTPVSALIHAATMVTAGVFMVCRLSPVMEFAPWTADFVVLVGAVTAVFAASVGLVQNDIKRVIAYSTCSQLGYMFVAAGVGAYPVAMFHLFTHAFFKAMLFLGAGSVIHAMHHEQDMRNYGGLRQKLPWTFWAMLVGTLSITGVGIPLTIFGFAGFQSKDAIIESTYAATGAMAGFAFWTLVVTALMTSFYSWRLIFMTFCGRARGNTLLHDQAHESPLSMLIPLAVLAVGAIAAGMVWYEPFFGYHAEEYFAPSVYIDHTTNTVMHDAHDVPAAVKVLPFAAMAIGFAVAWLFYIRRPDLPVRLAESQYGIHAFLLNKWYVDELYELAFVRPAKGLGRFFWKLGDGRIIDGTINGLAMGIIPWFTRLAGRAQSGFLFHYAFAMIIGLAAIISWFSITGAG